MSSNPTQPKSASPEGVNFPPEDDAEGHRIAANAEGAGQPEGMAVRNADEGFRVAAAPQGAEDDTEGHRVVASAEGAGQPEGIHVRGGFFEGDEDDTEGHRVVASGEGDGQPEGVAVRTASEGFRMQAAAEDDTEGHRVVAAGEGGPDSGPDGVAVR